MTGARRSAALGRKRTSDGRFASERNTSADSAASAAAASAATAQMTQPRSRVPAALLACEDPTAFLESQFGDRQGVRDARADLDAFSEFGSAQTAAARRLAAAGHDPKASVFAALLGPLGRVGRVGSPSPLGA